MARPPAARRDLALSNAKNPAMKPTLTFLAAACAAQRPGRHRANDFPTVDRVLYVQECMKTNPGPSYEMVNKCSCALDALAREVKYEDYVT